MEREVFIENRSSNCRFQKKGKQKENSRTLEYTNLFVTSLTILMNFDMV